MIFSNDMNDDEILALISTATDDLLNQINDLSQNILHEMIATGKTKSAIAIINRKILNLEQKDHQGRTALHYSAEYNNFETGAALIANGADPNAQNSFGNTPLWSSLFSAKGDYRLFSSLINNGADPDIKNNQGKSTREVAITTGKTLATEIIETFKSLST